jgi:hypothetical protein
MSARREALERLYDATVSALAHKIAHDGATAADLNVARALLRDAGISVDPQHPDKPTAALVAALAKIDSEGELH